MAHVLCIFFRPVVVRWRRFQREAAEHRLSQLIVEAGRCKNRNELEHLLGQPRYAMAGELFAVDQESPDVVECYVTQGCLIELWFTDGRVSITTGSVNVSLLDVYSGVLEERPR